MLKSRNHHPPGGWAFFQAETGWNLPNPQTVSFDQAVRAIINHRQVNPRFKLPTDVDTVSAELEAFTEARLRSTYGDKANQWLIGAPATASPSSPLWRPLRARAAGAVAAVGADVKKAVAGIGLLKDWLGDGLKPVDAKTAESRAAICAVCPKNQKASLVQAAYGSVADGVHLLMNARTDLKLATKFDAQLHTCQACDCLLTLKVFTPGPHIKKHTSSAVFDALDPKCWIRTLP